MVRAALVLTVAIAVAACGALPQHVQTVNVPIEVARKPPRELVGCTKALEAPKFISSHHASASSCLTPEGEKQLTRLVDRVLTCEQAWEAWALKGQ